ncbi:MAG: hypothetical protein SWY16_24190, partial [Cyanobacteriota bacterium]|nr:hypothetical protein [Cyanobacteriota bacterium]
MQNSSWSSCSPSPRPRVPASPRPPFLPQPPKPPQLTFTSILTNVAIAVVETLANRSMWIKVNLVLHIN